MRTNRFIAALMLSACGAEQPTQIVQADAPAAGPLPTPNRYLPLAVGAAWVLHETDPATGVSADKTTTVEAYEDVGPSHPGKRAFRVRVEKLAGTSVYWEGVEAGVTVRYRNDDYDQLGALVDRVVNQPYRLKLDETPARLAVGTAFVESFAETTTDPSGTSVKAQTDRWSVIASSESVTVPMGQFNAALHVRRIGNTSGTKQKDYWYVQGVGKVKEDGSDKQVEELAAYLAP